MSNIYIQEPPTAGKVLLHTTVGDIEIELWSKEAPLASRNFVQLCLEGYYNNTIFHRLVPGFVVQGGDPSGTGFSGESIYGSPFKDELHSRLRFMRRGLLATANTGEKNSNGSQFFFTLDATPDLINKHTIFGKVVGDTLFNMLKLGESEVDANERPLFINRIIRTEVVINPFPDIEPRTQEGDEKLKDDEEKSDFKAKAIKNFGLLSFGDEAMEDEEETAAATAVFSSAKSSHDVGDDPLLSSQSVLSASSTVAEAPKDATLSRIQQKLKGSPETKKTEPKLAMTAEPRLSKAEELRHQAAELQKELLTPRAKPATTGAAVSDKKEKDSAVLEYEHGLDAFETRRRKVLKKGTEREERTLLRLQNFKEKLHSIRESGEQSGEPESKKVLEEGEDDNEDDKGDTWMKQALTFEEETQRDARDANLKTADWYEIFDPRNPMNKRKREASKKEDMSKKRTDKNDLEQ